MLPASASTLGRVRRRVPGVALALALTVLLAACVPPSKAASPPAAPATTQPPAPSPPGPPPPGAPDPAAFSCPVVGATFTDSYGPRTSGFHWGIDMFATTGTPARAVGPGTVSYAVEDAGGNAAYLFAADGNVYYYAHLSAFVGVARAVTSGETIGRVGQTGNATAPHLHFEIRVGGANGTRIDPYATLVAAGCSTTSA